MDRRQSVCYCQIENHYNLNYISLVATATLGIVIALTILVYRQSGRQSSIFATKRGNVSYGTANRAPAGKRKTICTRPLPLPPNTNSADMNKITQCRIPADCRLYTEIKQTNKDEYATTSKNSSAKDVKDKLDITPNYNGKSNICYLRLKTT